MADEADYIERIADDVLTVLTARSFFEALDDQMCPPDAAQPRAECKGPYEATASILFALGLDSDDVAEWFPLAAGGSCLASRRAPASSQSTGRLAPASSQISARHKTALPGTARKW